LKTEDGLSQALVSLGVCQQKKAANGIRTHARTTRNNSGIEAAAILKRRTALTSFPEDLFVRYWYTNAGVWSIEKSPRFRIFICL